MCGTLKLRRASHRVPFTSRGVVNSIKLLTLLHQGWTLNVIREHLETYSGMDDITNVGWSFPKLSAYECVTSV